MTFTVEIEPELQAALNRRAAARGVDVSSYALSLLQEAVRATPGSKELNRDQLDRTLLELARLSHEIPLLPDEAFARESIYRDDD